MTRTTRARNLVVAALVATLAAVGLAAPAASAADLTKFDPGNIVSDAVMFDGNDLTAAAAQNVLNTRGARCVPSSSGVPCLKDFRMTTTNKAADDRCSAYTGRANESAAEIITNVARACGISSRALIVMLQKEQGLVTASGSSLTNRRYEIAMGFGCPDTAPCDQQYYGFFNQVFRAAWQLETYRLYPNRYGHRAGVVNNVRFHPNASCGTSPVFIQNAATAGLYNYTPYQPNASALAAGYGTGDACASYGNRNFYQFFVDWFGSPTISVTGAIGRWYNSGGNAQRLGEPTANEQAVLNGFWQAFQNGDIYLNPTSTFAVLGPIRNVYRMHQGPAGPLGWPVTADVCSSQSLCSQTFEQGRIYTEWSAGSHAVIGPINSLHQSMGGVGGSLGLPLQGRTAEGNTWVQRFQGGRVFSSSAGTAALTGYLDSWHSLENRSQTMGPPVSNSATTSYGVRQQFANGSVHLTPSSATTVMGPMSRYYTSIGGDSSFLGRPLTEASCAATWCLQEFAGGRMYTAHGAGTWAMTSASARGYDAAGGSTVLGFPSSAARALNGGTVQDLQRGQLHTTTAGTFALRGYLLTWHGGERDLRRLGSPTANESAVAGGVHQRFANGSAYLAPSGTAYAVLGPIDVTYRASGASQGQLGWPVAGESCDTSGCFQQFQNGRIYRNPTGAAVLRGSMLQTLLVRGLGPQLGVPVSAEQPSGPGVLQRFTSGTLYLLPNSWATTLGPIETAYWRDGGPSSPAGWPLGTASCPASTWCSQPFTNGTTYTAHGAGTWTVLGPMNTYIESRGGITASGLGFPTGPRTAVGSSYEQTFQNGVLVQDARGAVTRR